MFASFYERLKGVISRYGISDLIRYVHLRFRSRQRHEKPNLNLLTSFSEESDIPGLRCRVHLDNHKGRPGDSFIVDISGSIHAPAGTNDAQVRVRITDITDGIDQAGPVCSQNKVSKEGKKTDFIYTGNLGRLPNEITNLSNWTEVAKINIDWLLFPHNGRRQLQFIVSIISSQAKEEIAHCRCSFSYENANFGYIDLDNNIQRARTLTVALAFAVSAEDQRLYNCEVELIKNWARTKIGLYGANVKAGNKFEAALDRTVEFFCAGNQLDIHKICREMTEIVPLCYRYDALELFLRVASAKSKATKEELSLIKNLAELLEVDMKWFRGKLQRIIPINMHEARDIELILGISSDMGTEQTRRLLNEEYRRWNARVTSLDCDIQQQADKMLELIAQARTEYIG
ncbi:MAG: hypothetical protein JXB29_00370 [Sedimentisphaerales bacterium]|nr:hypothetical protein [Sedimentisphaerales bacterium]